jgi:glycosyltransferase involved in cell wall biosynthesis
VAARLDAVPSFPLHLLVSALPLISVVLPVRNGARTVARAIASIRGQTLAEWELVIVDDGSTDETSDRLAAAAQEDARVRVVTQRALGLVAALNTGLAAARGALVARMDADDESHPERLARQATVFEADPGLGVVSCLVEFGGDRPANAGYALHVDWLNSVCGPNEIGLNRFVESPLAHPSVMFRRSVMERWGGYRAGDFPEDYELWLRWLDRGVVMTKVPETLVTWHDAPGRLSRTDSRYGPEAFFRLKAEYLALHLARIGRTTVWIWGAGRPTRKRAAMLTAHGVNIAGYIDVDPRKTGVRIAGVPVIAAEDLPPADGRFVLSYVSKRGARDWIRGELGRRNYVEGRDFLACA